MLNFINRGIEKIKTFFEATDKKSEKCRKCSVIKSDGLSPAIIFSERSINHEECDSNCSVDNKFMFIMIRLIIVFLIGYIVYRYGVIALDVISYYFK